MEDNIPTGAASDTEKVDEHDKGHRHKDSKVGVGSSGSFHLSISRRHHYRPSWKAKGWAEELCEPLRLVVDFRRYRNYPLFLERYNDSRHDAFVRFG